MTTENARITDLNLWPRGKGFRLARLSLVGSLLFSAGGELAPPARATSVTAELIALEVNQAVQDWRNSVPLVAGKPTLVRAHLRAVNASQARVEGRLRAFAMDGRELPGSPLSAINPGGFVMARSDAHQLRANLEASLNFLPPLSWLTNRIRLAMHWVNGNVRCANAAEPGGAPNDCAVELSFQNVPALPVAFVKTAWRDGAGVSHEPATRPHLFELADRLRAIYPVSQLHQAAGVLAWDNRAPTNLTRLSLQLATKRLADGCGAGCDRLDYGVTIDAPAGGLAADIPGEVAAGNLPGDGEAYGRNRHAHELAHCLGRQHAWHHTFGYYTNAQTGQADTNLVQGACGEYADWFAPEFPMELLGGTQLLPALGPLNAGEQALVYGYDHHARRVVDPFLTFDLMSYCGRVPEPPRTRWRWISRYTYTNLLNAIVNRYGAGGAPPPRLAAGAPQDYLLVRGEISLTSGTGELLPLTAVTSAQTPPAPPPGEYRLRVLDLFGGVLEEVAFAPIRPDPDAPEEVSTTGTFLIAVPWNPLARHVVVLRQIQPVLSRSASASPPAVAVTFPNGGETLGTDPVTLSWQAADAEAEALSFLVEYSADDGASWETLAVDWPGRSLTVRQDALQATTRGRLRVRASDGFHVTADVSDGTFTVPNHAPELAVRQPAAESLFFGNQALVLEAQAFDADEGWLNGSRLVWRSSRNGVLGSGPLLTLEAGALSEGRHTVTVTAGDAAGATNSAAVSVVVLRQWPELAIARAGSRVVVSWPVTTVPFLLQSSPALSAAGWTTMTGAPAMTAGLNVVTNTIAGAARFYRLRATP